MARFVFSRQASLLCSAYMYNVNSIPLSEALNIYIDWKATYTHYAHERYKRHLMDFKAFLGENMFLAEITNLHIQKFIHFLKTKPIKNNMRYSDTTISYSINILKNFIEFWKGRGATNLNPKEIQAIRFIKKYKEHCSIDDFEDLCDTLDIRYYEDLVKKLTLHLLWDTGMRVSELIEMNLADIREKGENGLRTAVVRTRKTMRYNLVVWSKQTDELLIRYLAHRLDFASSSDALLINRKNKTRYTVKTIQRWIKQMGKDAQLGKEISPHSFRHSRAHYILDNGGNQRDVQAVLRHSNPLSSFHYLSLNEKHFIEIAGKYLTQK